MVDMICRKFTALLGGCGRWVAVGLCLAGSLQAFAATPQTNRLVDISKVWKYQVEGTDLGTAWSETGYSDGSWASGGGLLYVETDSLPEPKTTALPLSKPMPLTTYFRTTFDHSISNGYSAELVVNTVVDDGIVLYLNGNEVLRDNMPVGTVSFSTLATGVGNAEYRGPFYFDGDDLLDGVNVLAAEVHQSSANSSDVVMGLTMDVILSENDEPEIESTDPAWGTVVSNFTQVTVKFDEAVTGVDAADLLVNGVMASGLTVISSSEYQFLFAEPGAGTVHVTWATGHGIVDLGSTPLAFEGNGFGFMLGTPSEWPELKFNRTWQSSDFSSATTSGKSADGSPVTFSLTQDLPGSYWVGELGRPHELNQIQVVNRFSPDDAELAGLTLSVMNMDDQVIYETVLSNPGSGGIIQIDLPEGTVGRSVRIGLSGSELNGAGNYRVGLAEIRLFGDSQIPTMPAPYVAGGSDIQYTGFAVSQTTDFSAEYPAANAVDDDTGTFSHTDSSTLNNYWIADLGSVGPVARIELVDRGGNYYARMDNLVVRVLDGSQNSVASDVVVSPGSGGTYTFDPPEGTEGRYVKVGLENGETNGRGDYAIQLAEVRIYSEAVDASLLMATENLATDQRCYMLRLHDSLEPASNVNDGDMSTESVTTTQTVDGYWEVDLGATYALYGIRAVSAAAIGDRLTNTTCRLFDENHDSVLEKPVSGQAPSFDVDLDGPVYARYVRVGIEDKTRTDGNPGAYIGFKEVEVFGRPAGEVGILSFSASDSTVSSGQNVTFDWDLEGVHRAEIFPIIGSVGTHTDTNGVGSLLHNMTSSTEFILVASNKTELFTQAVGVEVNGAALPVVISEVVAENKYSLEDGYGDAPDWIELRNTGNSTVDLTGWGLSDKADEPMQWVFPATNIAPHSTLIVFASKNDASIDPTGYLHADFKLSNNGDSVYLTKPDGATVVDSLVDFPALDKDLAYGRALDGSWMFMEPTPNAVNTEKTYGGWLNALNWSHARGLYETNFTLTVSSDDLQATILYSLDGSEPSIPYTAGLPISGTSIVRVQAVWPGYKPARIQTKSFIFVDEVITGLDAGITQDPTYGPRVKPGLLALPTISLVVSAEGEAIDAIEYDEQACSLEIMGLDGQSPIQEDCGISRFGGAYSYFEKKAFSLAFRQKYGNGKLKAPLFNGFDRGTLARTSFDRLHLRGGNHDWSRSFGMSDRFIQDSYLDMGSLNPHGRFVHVYLNGEYWGQYNLKEVLNEAFLADYLGGSEEDYVSVKGNQNQGGWVIGVGDPPDVDPWELVRSLRNDFEAVSPYLDMSHFIDFMLLWGFGGAENEFRACGPKTAGSGFKFWINDPDGFVNDARVDHDRSIGVTGPGYIWQALHTENHVDFKMLVADRIYKNFFNDGAMTTAPCISRLEARMDEVRDSFLAECARWNRSYTDWEDDANTAYTSYFTHQADDMVAAWRNAGYLPSIDPPMFNQYGGAVEAGFQPVLTSPDGTIYYTIDGTDPRLSGGGISSAALVWTAGAVTITEDLSIATRVRTSGGEWSALADPRFLLGSRQLPETGDMLITEINFNPDGPDDYEFIEIWNSGTNLLDLSGVNISNAVRYIFPEYATLSPGAFVVVCEDAAAFSNRYQDAVSPWYWAGVEVAGEWVGGLSDGGETIVLAAADGSPISSVSYNVGGDWPDYPDGDGSSLELDNPALVPSDASAQLAYLADGRNWRASSLYHGSPGRFESAEPTVVINEVLSHTDVGVDWIEFYNSSASPFDLAGYALTDNLALPTRYLLPAGSMVPAYGYLTVSAADLGFGFSELGSSAILLEVSGSTVLRFLDRVDFPAVAREESFGRYLRSDDIPVFTEQASNTYGDENALPRVGPVVISEIMYLPTLGKSAYVELYNISDSDVPLYDLNITSNVWKVAGVGNYAFPEGGVLPPLTPMILCATNPAVFRAQYGIDASVPVYGPWSGSLDVDGEMLELLSPGDPEPDGFVPLYRADYVAYRTNAQWAVANTGNVSLERYPLNSYGNDPASWLASQAGGTPGTVGEYRSNLESEISLVAGDIPVIGFPAIPGQSYEVHYTDSLTPIIWNILDVIPSASSNWVSVPDPELPISNRFYRIFWETP